MDGARDDGRKKGKIDMGELSGIYAVWLRELKVFTREKSRVMGALFSPLLWIFVFGGGLGSSVSLGEGVGYQQFVFPGIVVMAVLFTSIFYGVYIIWDRKLDFLKEVLVAPVSRTSIFLAKVIGGTTEVLLEGFVLLMLGYAIGVSLTPASIVLAMLMLALIAAIVVSIGLIIGASLESLEGFGLIANFVVWPMFFFSGALFPISNLPPWLEAIAIIDPLTYGVDAMRTFILGTGRFPLATDVGVLLFFAALFILVGRMSFERMRV